MDLDPIAGIRETAESLESYILKSECIIFPCWDIGLDVQKYLVLKLHLF